MYKDKDKQREANRKAQAKFKAKGITQALVKGITEGIELQKTMGITEGISEKVLSDAELKAHFAKPNINAGEISENSSMNDEPTKPRRGKDIKPQSYNPMMVGYIPPKE